MSDVPLPSHDDLALLPREAETLRKYLDSWPRKNREERIKLKDRLITEFLTDRKIDINDKFARAYLRLKVGSWLSNRAATRDSRLPKALKTIWTGRDVFYLLDEKPIEARTTRIRQETGKIYIAALNAARSEMWNALTDEERGTWEEKADQWTNEGPDPELRAAIAEKRLGEWIQSFVLWCYDQCGALGKFDFCYLERAEEMKRGKHDISMTWHGADSSIPTYDEWQKNHPKRTWADWCHMCYHPEQHENDPDAPRATLPPHQFKFFDDGTPIFPPLEDFRHGKEMSTVMHEFLSLHWESASGVQKLPIAWKVVARDTSRFLPPDALPEGFVFQNPKRMSTSNVRQLWKHILQLQQGETWSQRFHWTHWWARSGTGEDSGDRRSAEYGQTPKARGAAKGKTNAHQAKRIKITRQPPKGAFGLNKPRDDSEEEKADEQGGKDQPRKHKGKGKATDSRHGKGKRNGKGKGASKRLGKSKNARGKEKARVKNDEDSDSAVSSGASSDSPEDVEMQLDTDRDSSESEVFDLDNISGSEDEVDSFALDDSLLRDPSEPGPSRAPAPGARQPPKPRPVRRAAGRQANPSERPPDVRSDCTPEPDTGKFVAGPWDDAPLGPQGLSTVRIPPRRTHLDAAMGRPPSWVGADPNHVLPFLWALSSEADYRNLLQSWRHMFRRRAHLRDPVVSEWANWDSDCWGVPNHLHQTQAGWSSVLDWISDTAPKSTSSASEVQQWSLVVGLALRDIYTANSIEPDPEEPVPHGGPEYLRSTTSTLRDALETILPLCSSSQHSGFDPDDADLPKLPAMRSRTRKAARVVGKRGKPPGIPHTRFTASGHGNKAQANHSGEDSSCDEVEMAVGRASSNPDGMLDAARTSAQSASTGAQGSHLRLSPPPNRCYVDLTVRPATLSSSAQSHLTQDVARPDGVTGGLAPSKQQKEVEPLPEEPEDLPGDVPLEESLGGESEEQPGESVGKGPDEQSGGLPEHPPHVGFVPRRSARSNKGQHSKRRGCD